MLPPSSTYTVRWADLDPNGHLRHSAYADFATDQRVQWLAALGYDTRRFAELQLGPVTFREETVFRHELRAGDTLRVEGQLTASTPGCTQWTTEHRIYRADGLLAATVTVEGAWFDLRRRKLVVPPPELAEALGAAPR